MFVRLPADGPAGKRPDRPNEPADWLADKRADWARAGLLCLRLKIFILGKNAGKARIFAHTAGYLFKLVNELNIRGRTFLCDFV